MKRKQISMAQRGIEGEKGTGEEALASGFAWVIVSRQDEHIRLLRLLPCLLPP